VPGVQMVRSLTGLWGEFILTVTVYLPIASRV
jgi:hypothetical protein